MPDSLTITVYICLLRSPHPIQLAFQGHGFVYKSYILLSTRVAGRSLELVSFSIALRSLVTDLPIICPHLALLVTH